MGGLQLTFGLAGNHELLASNHTLDELLQGGELQRREDPALKLRFRFPGGKLSYTLTQILPLMLTVVYRAATRLGAYHTLCF